jgi:hypothetical protein
MRKTKKPAALESQQASVIIDELHSKNVSNTEVRTSGAGTTRKPDTVPADP